MKIKVGDEIYDANDEIIMVILSKEDKINILNMDERATKYCAFPEDKYTDEEIEKFMEVKK